MIVTISLCIVWVRIWEVKVEEVYLFDAGQYRFRCLASAVEVTYQDIDVPA